MKHTQQRYFYWMQVSAFHLFIILFYCFFSQEEETDDETKKDKVLAKKVHNVLNNIVDPAAVVEAPVADAAASGPSMT